MTDDERTKIIVDLIWKLAEAEVKIEMQEIDGVTKPVLVADRNWLVAKQTEIARQIQVPN